MIGFIMFAMVVAGTWLDGLVGQCANNVGPITMKAIISVESGGNPYAIDDDDAHRSYSPKTLQEAIAIVMELNATGHNYDAGIVQVNSSNFEHEGLSLGNMFEPCANVRAGARILGRSYQAAANLMWLGHVPSTQQEQHQQEQMALRHAFSIYNSGSAWHSMHYSDMVIAAAQNELTYRPPTPINDPLQMVTVRPHLTVPTIIVRKLPAIAKKIATIAKIEHHQLTVKPVNQQILANTSALYPPNVATSGQLYPTLQAPATP